MPLPKCRGRIVPAALALLLLGAPAAPRRGYAETAAAPADSAGKSAGRPNPFDYSGLSALLARHVRKGRVDYAGWRKAGVAELDRVLAAMSDYPYTRVLSREARLAFLVNFYNASVIRSVLEAWPVAGVKDIPGFFDAKKHRLNGAEVTLDDIEKNLIAGTFGDMPLRHWVLVCGARGCPPLRSSACHPDSLAIQAGAARQAFMADSTNARFDATDNLLYLSEFFRWHRPDFEQGDVTLPRYLAPNFSLGVALKIMKDEPRIEFMPFDWRLNAAAGTTDGR